MLSVLVLSFQLALAGLTKRDWADVWYPLPDGFDQSKPNSILELFQAEDFPFKKVYVFGDSSSDTGNLFKLNRGLEPDPKVYWKGRESNGPMWPDYLQAIKGLDMKNFAFGGAVINNKNHVIRADIPDLGGQLDLYDKDKFDESDGNPLAIIAFDGNDMINPNISGSKVASDLGTNLQRLVDGGEIKDMVVLLSTNEHYVARGINKALITKIKSFQESNLDKDVKIMSLDAMEFSKSMAKQAPPTADAGIWATQVSCHDQNIKTLCADPQNHFLFDLYHPSTVPNFNTARFIADAVIKFWE